MNILAPLITASCPLPMDHYRLIRAALATRKPFFDENLRA